MYVQYLESKQKTGTPNPRAWKLASSGSQASKLEVAAQMIFLSLDSGTATRQESKLEILRPYVRREGSCRPSRPPGIPHSSFVYPIATLPRRGNSSFSMTTNDVGAHLRKPREFKKICRWHCSQRQTRMLAATPSKGQIGVVENGASRKRGPGTPVRDALSI